MLPTAPCASVTPKVHSYHSLLSLLTSSRLLGHYNMHIMKVWCTAISNRKICCSDVKTRSCSVTSVLPWWHKVLSIRAHRRSLAQRPICPPSKFKGSHVRQAISTH